MKLKDFFVQNFLKKIPVYSQNRKENRHDRKHIRDHGRIHLFCSKVFWRKRIKLLRKIFGEKL